MQRLTLATGTVELATGVLQRPGGEPVQLSTQEVALLRYLAERPNQDVPRDELLVDVLGYAPMVRSRAVDDALKRLRAKVERLPARPFHLVGVRGVGYRFVPLDHRTGLGLLRIGRFTVDLERLEARADDGAVQTLSAIEGRLLEVLDHHDGRPVRPETLLREVWGIHHRDRTRIVDKALYRLRQKLEETPDAPTVLRTVRGKGLLLESGGVTPRPELRPGRPRLPQTEVFGREMLARRVAVKLRTPGVVVTLHGPGGIGKTTLASLVAAERDGASLHVDLHGIEHAGDLVRAVAAAAGVDSDRWDRVRASLALEPELLLVLDNADTALDAVRAAVGELPGQRVLVTSRQPLALAREVVVPVDALEDADAAALVVSRAADAGVALTPDEPGVSALVRGLEGVPLALELAVARLRLLGLDGVLDRLARPLELLRSRQGGRHATMKVAVELSTDLLTASERRLLAAVTVFRGPFSLEAAEEVCGELVDEPVIDGIERLLDHALLGHDGRDRLRLGLAVADVVADWPETRSLAPELEARMVDWAAGLHRPVADDDLPDPEAMRRLRRELDGAVIAVRVALRRGSKAQAVACACWAAFVALHSGRASDAEALVREVEPVIDGLPPGLLARYHLVAGKVFGEALDVRRTRHHLLRLAEQVAPESTLGCRALGGLALTASAASAEERAETLAELDRRIERVGGMARSVLLRARGWVRHRSGALDQAREDLQAALTGALAAGVAWDLAGVYRQLAVVAELGGHFAEAESMLENRWRHLAPAVSRDEDGAGLVVLIRIREGQGRLQEALDLVESELLRARTQGHRGNITHQLGAVANTRAFLGRLEDAMVAYREALAHAQELDNRDLIASLTLNMGEVSAWLGEREQALQLLRRGRALFEESGGLAYAAMGRVLEGRVLLRSGERSEAEALFREALVTLRRLGRAEGQADACLGLAELHVDADPNGALRWATEGLAVARAHGKAGELAALVAWHGRIALALGRRDVARRACDEAAGLIERHGLGARSGAGQALAELRSRLENRRTGTGG